MSYLRRQRRKLLLITLLILQQLIRQIHCQATLKQYNHRSSNTNNNNNINQQQLHNNNILVSDFSQQLAQNLPLIRQQQQQQQQPDLDNVIESTTSLVALQQQQQQHQTQRQSSAKISAASTASCQLPSTWAGKWYQSNKEPIRVTRTEISDKGLCRDQKGDKYLFEYAGSNSKLQSQLPQQQQQQLQTSPCLVCLVINERHLNVLQYKESSCQPIPANYYNRTSLMLDDDHSLLDSICSDITGDAQLESLFRLDTPPIECPISGQYSFTYDSCREPQSSLDSCIDKKQLNFKFLACPDVPGSESKTETLKCYADWSEGNNYYMIGRLESTSNHQDKDKFRCFIYEKSPDGKFIPMSQSLEESCSGLINANEGPKTLRLTAKPPTTQKCNFPPYIQSLSENWLSVDNSLIYMFNQNSTKYQVKETKEGSVIEEATCLQQFNYPQALAHPHPNHARSGSQQQVITNKRYPTSTSNYPQADQSFQHTASRLVSNEVVYLVQITKKCQTTNYCVRFYRRSNGIVQIDYFINSPNSDNQCRVAFQATAQTQIITSTNLEHQRCPFEGGYTIEAPIESDLTYNPSNIFICPNHSFLTAQCEHTGRLQILSRCSTAARKYLVKNLYCLGSWTTNGLVRLVLADDDRQRYSAWYRDHTYLQQPAAESSDSSSTSSPQTWSASQQQQPITRSQHLLTGAAAAANGISQQQQQQPAIITPIATSSVVDLQIALISQQPTKSMQVRLTRRNQCSDLQRYNQNVLLAGTSFAHSGNSMPSSLTSATATSSATSSFFLNHHHHHHHCCCSCLSTLLRLSMVIVVTLFMSRLPVANSH